MPSPAKTDDLLRRTLRSAEWRLIDKSGEHEGGGGRGWGEGRKDLGPGALFWLEPSHWQPVMDARKSGREHAGLHKLKTSRCSLLNMPGTCFQPINPSNFR